MLALLFWKRKEITASFQILFSLVFMGLEGLALLLTFLVIEHKQIFLYILPELKRESLFQLY